MRESKHLHFIGDLRKYGFRTAWYNLRFRLAFQLIRARRGNTNMTVKRDIDEE